VVGKGVQRPSRGLGEHEREGGRQGSRGGLAVPYSRRTGESVADRGGGGNPWNAGMVPESGRGREWCGNPWNGAFLRWRAVEEAQQDGDAQQQVEQQAAIDAVQQDDDDAQRDASGLRNFYLRGPASLSQRPILRDRVPLI
jgi:hypothetical protein